MAQLRLLVVVRVDVMAGFFELHEDFEEGFEVLFGLLRDVTFALAWDVQ